MQLRSKPLDRGTSQNRPGTNTMNTGKQKVRKLEHELQEKESECSELKEQLRNPEKKKERLDKFMTKKNEGAWSKLTEDGFPSFDKGESQQRSPINSIGFTETMSTTRSGDEGFAPPTNWSPDFDTVSPSSPNSNDGQSQSSKRSIGYDANSFADQSQPSRRSMERDALRKYVRKRYLKSKEKGLK